MNNNTLVKLWGVTLGHEIIFSDYIKEMTKDTCTDGDIIALKISDMVLDFKYDPPEFNINQKFKSGHEKVILDYVFEWFENYKNGIKPNKLWAD